MFERRQRYFADFLWEEFKLIVETDGRRWHSGYIAASVDHEKDRAFKALGYEMMRFTWADVVNHPGRTAREIHAAMQRRRRELAR